MKETENICAPDNWVPRKLDNCLKCEHWDECAKRDKTLRKRKKGYDK